MDILKSTIIITTENNRLFSQNQIDKNAALVLDELPLKIEKLIDKINTHLIKQKYNFQAKINIKNYTLNFIT